LKFGKRKLIQREIYRWRRDRDGSPPVRETGAKTQSSKRIALGRLTLGEAADLGDAGTTQGNPGAKESDVGQAGEMLRVEELLSRVRYLFRNVCNFFQKVLLYIARCNLYMKILLKNNKTLICCTGFPTMGFYRDNCPKIIVVVFVPVFSLHLISTMF